MSILQQVCDKMQEILRGLPDTAAVESGMLQRRRKLTGSALAKILILGWLEHPEASYQQLAETASCLGIHVSRQAIEQRLTPETTEMLKITLKTAIAHTLEVASDPQASPLLQHFNGVYVQDSTWVSLPDERHEIWKGHPKKNHPKKAALKLHLRFDVLTGGFQHFQLTDGMAADSTTAKTSQPLPHGSLHLADLAYFSLDTFEKLTENGIYWISRLKANSYLADPNAERLSLENLLKQTQTENTFIRERIRIGKKKETSGVSHRPKTLRSSSRKTTTLHPIPRQTKSTNTLKNTLTSRWIQPLYYQYRTTSTHT